MNKVILMGRIIKDLELRYTQAATPVAVLRFTIAVSRKFKKENEPEADFLNCFAFGKTAENISRFFAKGRLIAVEGHIQTGNYTNKEKVKVYTTDIVVENFDFTGEKKDTVNAPVPAGEIGDGSDEDLPY